MKQDQESNQNQHLNLKTQMDKFYDFINDGFALVPTEDGWVEAHDHYRMCKYVWMKAVQSCDCGH